MGMISRVDLNTMLTDHSNALQPENLFPGNERRPRRRKYARILNFFYVLLTLVFGASLLVLPWSSLWDSNYLLYLYPKIRLVVANPFFKGAVLGLGIANIMIGFDEIGYLKYFSKGRFVR
jgi:hypothetical protein